MPGCARAPRLAPSGRSVDGIVTNDTISRCLASLIEPGAGLKA